jgi:hypothetical protein
MGGIQRRKREGSYLGLRACVDTHFFPTSRSPEREELWKLFKQGRIQLAMTDVLGTELAGDTDEDRRARLEASAMPLEEAIGPWVLGHSRLKHTVLATKEDALRLDQVIEVLFPGRGRTDLDHHDLRDAMHIATAKRYGYLFLTDDKRLLRRSQKLLEIVGVQLLSFADAVAFIQRKAMARESNSANR